MKKDFIWQLKEKKYCFPNNKDWKTLLDNFDIRRYIFNDAMENNVPFLVEGGGIF